MNSSTKMPVRTTVQAGLIKILVEIDCVAVLPDETK